MARMVKSGGYKFAICTVIAFVIMLVGAACFAVSFAAWQSGVSSVEAYGSVGLFYVDFDRPFASESGEVPAEQKEALIRSVKASAGDTYRNYVCVRREHSFAADGTLADINERPIAYIYFSVTQMSDPTVKVKSFSVRRCYTDENGVPIAGDDTDMQVFRSPVGRALSAVNNTYLILDFGSGVDKFYALDVTIVTEGDASYVLTATAKHKNIDARKIRLIPTLVGESEDFWVDKSQKVDVELYYDGKAVCGACSVYEYDRDYLALSMDELTLTAIKQGKTRIIVTAEYGDVEVEQTLDALTKDRVSVQFATPDISVAADKVYDIDEKSDIAQADVIVTVNDKPRTENLTLEYTVDNRSVAEVGRSSGIVSGISAGNTKLNVKYTHDGGYEYFSSAPAAVEVTSVTGR